MANGGSLQTRPDVPEWVKKVYVTAPEISPEDHVLMQATFQKHVDSGISKTINFANTALLEDVEKAVRGLKRQSPLARLLGMEPQELSEKEESKLKKWRAKDKKDKAREERRAREERLANQPQP